MFSPKQDLKQHRRARGALNTEWAALMCPQPDVHGMSHTPESSVAATRTLHRHRRWQGHVPCCSRCPHIIPTGFGIPTGPGAERPHDVSIRDCAPPDLHMHSP